MANLKDAGQEQRGGNPAVRAGEPTEKTVEDFLKLPHEQRLELFEAVAVRVLPRLEGVEPRGFLQSLRTAPRADARMDWPSADAERAESFDEVFEDLMEQPIGEQRRILELVGPRILSDVDQAGRAKFLDDLQAKLDLSAEGANPDELSTRH